MGLFDRLRGDDEPRVAFFGIDGVPYSLVSNHPDEFPNLNRLEAEGAGGAIDSIVPPESSACWPALTTGKNPGETGVYGFQDREIGSYDPYVPSRTDVQAERVWDRVHDADRQATVMNVPVTFPPQRNVQRMVSGFLSPGLDKAAFPEEMHRYLEGIDYRLDVNAKLGHQEDKREFIDNAHAVLDARFEAFANYVEADDWDLFFGVFMSTDRVNHFLFEHYERDGEYREDFLEFYRKLDDYVGQLVDMLPDDVTALVASDHGFTTLDYEVNCNRWLQKQGWLEYAEDDHEELSDIADSTRAYSFIPGRFYINLEGREPRGSVPEDEYDDVRDELKSMLEDLEGPDGKKVADRVVEKEQAFRGDHADIAPDLVVVPNHGFDLKSGFGQKEAVFNPDGPRNGMHSFDNACLFSDDARVRVGDDVDLYDIAPTVMDGLSVDYARAEFDGDSLLVGE